MKNDNLIIHGKFQSIMALTRRLDQSPKRFGTDELLTHAEIHLIEITGDQEGQSVTDIGKKLGITKGAVSQNLKRLDSKGYTAKNPDPENLFRTIVLLTE